MSNLYSRQEELDLHIPSIVTVVGCGGIGSWVAIDLAMSGVGTLYLFDPDILEDSNRNRLPFCVSSVGRPKVEVVADFIKAIRPDAIIFPIQERLDGIIMDIQTSVCQFFMDCTDSPKTQIKLYNSCKDRHLFYIRAGYDGTHITITSNVSGWIKEGAQEETYEIRPSWVVPAQIAAALAVAKLLKYHNQEVSLDISEIGIPVVKRAQGRKTARCKT